MTPPEPHSPQPIRVLFVAHTGARYGASRSLLALVTGLMARGVACHVVVAKRAALLEDLEQAGIPYSVIPFAWWMSPGSPFWRRLLRSVSHVPLALVLSLRARAIGATLIYTNSIATPVGALAAWFARVPHIWHIREFVQEDYGFQFDLGTPLSLRLVRHLSAQVIVISQALHQKFRHNFAPEQLLVVHNPVVLTAPPPTDPTAGPAVPVLVLVGRLHPAKGQHEAVLALAELTRQGLEAHLLLVGDGDDLAYQQRLQAIIEREGLHDEVTFTGFVPDTTALLHTATIVLMCSQSEAFGRTTIEGMLASKPVVGACSGATPELVQDGHTGLLYHPGDHHDLARKIAYLLAHPAEAVAMGQRGAERVATQFSPEEHVQTIYNLLHRR